MKRFYKILQQAWFRLLIAPIGYFIFGAIVGSLQAGHVNWWSLAQLAIYTSVSHLLEHFLFVRYTQKQPQITQPVIWWGLELILVASLISSIWLNYWVVTLLLVIRVLFIHILYFPYNISTSGYRLFYRMFFDGIVLNIISYFNQRGTVTNEFLLALIPIMLVVCGLTLEELRQQRLHVTIELPNRWLQTANLTYGLLFGGLILALYFSWPSHSYWLWQIAFVIGSGSVFLPLIVPTFETHQVQNKINFLYAVNFIFSLLYCFSYLW